MTEKESTENGTTGNGTSCSRPDSSSSNGSKMGGMCLNWKVIGGLAAVGLGIWVVAPNLVLAAAPLLLFAACPLSMWLMMRGMSGGQQNRSTQPSNASGLAQGTTEAEVETGTPRDLAALKAAHARLTAELEALENDVRGAKTEPNGSREPLSTLADRGSQETTKES